MKLFIWSDYTGGYWITSIKKPAGTMGDQATPPSWQKYLSKIKFKGDEPKAFTLKPYRRHR